MRRRSGPARAALIAPVLAAALTVALGGCGRPRPLPVQVKQCDTVLGANSVLVTARVLNGSPKAVRSVRVVLEFYHGTKVTPLAGAATFTPPLAPKDVRSVPLTVALPPSGIGGEARSCDVVHVEYADGSTAGASL